MFKDLNKVVVSDVCTQNGIGFGQIFRIETKSTRVQSCLENSILAGEKFTDQDVLDLLKPSHEVVRNEEWHRADLQKLGDVIINMLDTSDSVIEHLSSPSFPVEYKPEDLMPMLH